MIGIGLGVAQIRKAGASVAPDYVEPVDDDPIAPPAGEPEPPTITPIDPVTEEPEPGFDPAFTLSNRIDITDSGQSAVRTTNDPNTYGIAYVASPISGNEYWEYDIRPGTPRNATFAIGIATLAMPLNGIPGERATEIAWWSDGTVRQNGTTLVNLGSAGQLGRGDLAGMAINAAGEVFLFKNCTALNAGAAVGSLASGTRHPFVALYSARTQITMQFSTARFDCALPDGFFPIGQAPFSGVVALTSVGSGTWTVPAGVTNLDEVLIVAGGGGGGSGSYGAGGGAGGLIYLTNVTVTPGQSISYAVGDGGTGGVATTSTNPAQGVNGQNSVFGANTATGGGGGGGGSLGDGDIASSGRAGGSGGGRSKTAGTSGAGTSGQGNAGGNGLGNVGGGGGGGHSTVGAAAVSGQAGAGGGGSFYSTFASFGQSGFFAGGGGGGAGGATLRSGAGGNGGGGDGGLFPNDNTSASFGSGRDGLANTGGGGGGPKNNGTSTVVFNGGKGGSGVILIYIAPPA
jgi:hypothetical protein